MSKNLSQLCRELKIRIDLGNVVTPAFCALRLQRTIEGSIDLAQIEILRQKFELVPVSLLYVSRVDDAFPIRILESGSATIEHVSKSERITLIAIVP